MEAMKHIPFDIESGIRRCLASILGWLYDLSGVIYVKYWLSRQSFQTKYVTNFSVFYDYVYGKIILVCANKNKLKLKCLKKIQGVFELIKCHCPIRPKTFSECIETGYISVCIVCYCIWIAWLLRTLQLPIFRSIRFKSTESKGLDETWNLSFVVPGTDRSYIYL